MSFDSTEWSEPSRVSVAWGDMDAFNHVNNTRYFRYFEDARIHYFRALGVLDLSLAAEIGPIVKSTQCEFVRPIKYPDELLVYARTTTMRESSFVMQYAIWSQVQGMIVALGDAVIVMVDNQTGKKCPVPAVLRGAIERQEKRTF